MYMVHVDILFTFVMHRSLKREKEACITTFLICTPVNSTIDNELETFVEFSFLCYFRKQSEMIGSYINCKHNDKINR